MAVRAAVVDLTHRQNVGLAAKSTDPFQTAYKRRPLVGLGTFQLVPLDTPVYYPMQFLINGLFQHRQIAARLGRCGYYELATQLSRVIVC